MELVNNLVSKLKYDSELKEDLFKIGTMLVVSRAFKDGDLNGLDNKKFLMETGATLLGFAVYHLVVKDYAQKLQLANAQLQKVAHVAMKVGTVLVVSKLLKGKQLDLQNGSYVVAGYVTDALLSDCLGLEQYFDDPRMKKVADDFMLAAFTTLAPRVVKGGRVTKKALQEVVAKTVGFAVYDFLLA